MQDGQREADGPRAGVVLERLGPVELFPHVGGDFAIQVGLAVGKLVWHGIGPPLRKQRRGVET